MASQINDVVQAARQLEDAKFKLEALRNEKSNAQARIDQINLAIPTAKDAVVAAKAALEAAVAAFSTN